MTPDEIIEVLQGVKDGRVWEASGNAIDWGTPPDQCAENLCAHISVGTTVRLAPLPDEITIPARVIPAPLREAPAVGTPYWVATALEENFCFESCWDDDQHDRDRLSAGVIHLTEDRASKAGKAMCPYA